MLTKRQHDALLFIDSTIKGRGYAPTQQEIADQFGAKSRSAGLVVVHTLVDLGYLRRLPQKRQGIEVVRLPGETAPDARAAIGDAVAATTRLRLDDAETDDLIGVLRARGFDIRRAA